MPDPIDSRIQRGFDDTIDALNKMTTQQRLEHARHEIVNLKDKITSINPPGKVAANAKLDQAEAALVVPSDGVSLGLVNEAHAILIAA